MEQGSHCSRGCIPSLLTARYMKEATVNSQDPAELPGDYKELPPQPPTPQDSENNKIFPVLSHKVLGLLLMQHELTDTPRRWDGQGGSYSVSAGSVRPKGWLPWVGEEPPRSHSGSFPMNQLFISGGQSIGASASALGLPMDIQN